VSTARVHLILVPGFGGFDVLGELEYYAGTTRVFQAWRQAAAQHPAARQAVLHYFDNFPTAGVKTRAALLREFIAKRLARNDIREAEDRIVLIGHSTGGLDIRQLLCDLTGSTLESAPGHVSVDGSRENAVELDGARLRRLIERVVFLSVPQQGTNIANWVREHGGARRLLSSLLRTAVDASDVPGLESVDVWWSNHVTRPLLENAEQKCGLRVAVADVRLELAERGSADPLRAAKGRSAHANVNLWLNHVHNDFLAIEDLSFGESGQPSPAHFTAEQQRRELSGWQASQNPSWPAIAARSYATLGRCPFDDAWQTQRSESGPGRVANVLEVLRDAFDAGKRQGTSDIAYRLGYRICSEGPFVARSAVVLRELSSEGNVSLEAWQNDGIVNTASMAWPVGETVLVHADHGDIIGHYVLREAGDSERGRKYHTYDILESSSSQAGTEFGERQFDAVWHDVFDFAILGS
jgi:triacylglycerol lipase